MRVLALAKQVPTLDCFVLDDEGRMRREGVPSEMSAYCRRAVAKAVEIARVTDGRSMVASLGPPQAEEILRESLAWGADEAVLLSDREFAGSDSLATARALAALIELEGPFDLIFVGRSSLDAETGQVGPELAELLDLPFASAVRHLEIDPEKRSARIQCESDDGSRIIKISLPAIIAVAERLCAPAKVSSEIWQEIPSSSVRKVSAADLRRPGPWGVLGSPTRLGESKNLETRRNSLCFDGPLQDQAEAAFYALSGRGVFDRSASAVDGPIIVPENSWADGPIISVLCEPNRPKFSQELLGCALSLSGSIKGRTVAISAQTEDLAEVWSWGADEVVRVEGGMIEEDFAAAAKEWAKAHGPVVMLAPASYWGREVASRIAASLGAGLTGDAIDLEIDSGRLIAWKSACGDSQHVAIISDSPLQMVTLRPGVYRSTKTRVAGKKAIQTTVVARNRGRVQVESAWRDDDWDLLAKADVVVGVGAGVKEEEYGQIREFAAVLKAELAGTRKVTDLGLLPKSRQIGITGRSISPRLYIAVGLSGKLNHMVGVRGADTILAINTNRDAPVFGSCDFGIVGDWRDALPLLTKWLS